LVGAISAGLLISGCTSEGGPHRDYVAAGVDYDGFYDDYYGPYADGYWGPDDYFYFSAGSGRPFRRDDDHHFRHDAASGFHPVHGHHAGPVPGAK
jgi:hypothetical protein